MVLNVKAGGVVEAETAVKWLASSLLLACCNGISCNVAWPAAQVDLFYVESQPSNVNENQPIQ
jgi:hypothetical protein